MANERLNWAIVSCGDIVSKRVGQAISTHENCRLVAMYSTDIARAQEFCRRFTTANSTPDASDQLGELLSRDDIDAVYVASQVDRHCPETIAAAEHGKHVLCEKPMALTVEECRRMIDTCRASMVSLAVSYYRRWYSKVRMMKELVKANAIGKVVRGHIMMTGRYDPTPDDPKHWRVIPPRSGGGAMMDTGSHRLDLMCYLLGRPRSVCGYAGRLSMHYEVPDTETLIAEFENGAHVTACLNWNLHMSNDVFELHGTEGSMIATPLDGAPFAIIRGGGQQEFHLPRHENPHIALIESFTQRILAGQEPEFTGEDGLLTNQIICGGYESARTGKTVELISRDS